jgi:hypothetical protein
LPSAPSAPTATVNSSNQGFTEYCVPQYINGWCDIIFFTNYGPYTVQFCYQAQVWVDGEFIGWENICGDPSGQGGSDERYGECLNVQGCQEEWMGSTINGGRPWRWSVNGIGTSFLAIQTGYQGNTQPGYLGKWDPGDVPNNTDYPN